MTDVVCAECEGRQGRSYIWDDDDDRGIRHEDWVSCPECKGTGIIKSHLTPNAATPILES